MSDYAVVGFEPVDAERGVRIVAALRDAGVEVHGDTPILNADDPETMATISGAWLVVALWSPASIDRDGSHALDDAAKEPAGRGAYLGVILDGAHAPFGFGGLHAIDMGSWGGENDEALARLVDTVRQRMKLGAVGSFAPMTDDTVAVAGRKRRTLLGVAAVAVLGVLAVAGILSLYRERPSLRAQIDAKLVAIPCSWLKVDPVDDGARGLLAITGVADQPDRAGATIRGLVTNAKVTTDRIARISSNDCPAIDVPRRLRQDEGGRLRVVSDGVGYDPASHLAQARVELDFRVEDVSMALFGIEPNGTVTLILPDYQALENLAHADVGFAQPTPTSYEFTLGGTHLGWTGLLLVTGDAPLPPFTGHPTPNSELIGMAAPEFGAWLQRATDHGAWHTEMQWYRIEPR